MRRFAMLAMAAALTLPAVSAQALLPQDDAGSGTDAPGTPTPAFQVATGTVHTGVLEGAAGDSDDWYAFTAPAGAALQARVSATFTCITIHDAAGVELGITCAAGGVALGAATGVATVTGTYYLRVTRNARLVDANVPQAYRFSIGVDATAPAPAPTDLSEVLPPADLSLPPVAPASVGDEHVVVAVVDTGINPYHDFFSAPALSGHPSGWLPGFPASAASVGLSLGAPTYAAATADDAATWAGLRRSAYDPETDTYDEHLYTFPGTRIVGAVSFGELEEPGFPLADPTPVRDDNGHGTHSAGLAGGANLAAADGNVLLVVVEVGQGTFEEGIRWAARQPWIDAVSVSLGGRANAPVTYSPIGDRQGAEWATLEAHQSGKPVFLASGNGVSGTGYPPDRCTTYTSPYTGPAWVTRVGSAKAGNGNPTWWHCVPVEVNAKTDVNSPSFDSTTSAGLAGGTSASTPNVAGHFAHLLLAGRRAGVSTSRLATLDHLLKAATVPPVGAGTNAPSVAPLSLADQGYGLVDQAALDSARGRLLAGTGPAPRPETTEWFARDREIRLALWGPGSATAQSQEYVSPQADAGQVGDAPSSRSGAVPVSARERYTGTLTWQLDGDDEDWYAVTVAAGDAIAFHAAGANLCYELVAPSGAVADDACSVDYAAGDVLTATAASAGTWYLRVHDGTTIQPYVFGVGVNAPPPPLAP